MNLKLITFALFTIALYGCATNPVETQVKPPRVQPDRVVLSSGLWLFRPAGAMQYSDKYWITTSENAKSKVVKQWKNNVIVKLVNGEDIEVVCSLQKNNVIVKLGNSKDIEVIGSLPSGNVDYTLYIQVDNSVSYPIGAIKTITSLADREDSDPQHIDFIASYVQPITGEK